MVSWMVGVVRDQLFQSFLVHDVLSVIEVLFTLSGFDSIINRKRQLDPIKKSPTLRGQEPFQWLIGASQLGQLQIDDQRTGK